jgi:putative tricarboxylic transport membrane protein
VTTPARRAARLPGEVGFVLVLLLVSVFMLWQAFLISGFDSLSSPGVFPMIATATMLVSGLIILGDTRRLPPEDGGGGWERFRRRIAPLPIALFTALIVAYVLLLERAGFLLSSYLFLVASMLLLGSRRIVLTLLVSAGALAAIHIVFRTVFSVVLPKGVLLDRVLLQGVLGTLLPGWL